MKRQKRNCLIIFIAFMIIVNSIINAFSPGIKIRDAVEVFFCKQMDVLAAMGGKISKEGIQSAFSEAYVLLQTDTVKSAS